MMTGPDLREVLTRQIDTWLADPDSAVEYAEELDGRWAVRIRQETRDATTVWFTPGERSLRYEAYVLPVPPGATDVFREVLVRNGRSWRAFFALDDEGGLVLRGRMARHWVTPDELELVLGEIYEMVEVAFRSLVRSAFETRENSG